MYQQSGRPNPVMHRTGAMPYFFRNRSHETGPTQIAQPESQISQVGPIVERNSSDTAERISHGENGPNFASVIDPRLGPGSA
jgi:hypothetical protein